MFGSVIEFLSQLLKPQNGTSTPLQVAETCSSPSPAAANPPPVDLGQFQQVMGLVSELTSNVAKDVGQHNQSIQAISTELTSVGQSDASAVAAIVCRLLVANQELQGRLERAEATLQNHSRQLNDAVTSARTDALTGLLNRRALDEKLNVCLTDFDRQGQPSTLLILDVDRFKQFNDTFGHVIGDQGLIHVAGSLRSRMQSMDILARFGGEEFVVIFCGQTATDVRQRAESIRRSIGQRPLLINGSEKIITASAGLAELVARDTVADWLKRADAALYAAKDGGRDCSFELTGPAVKKIEFTPDSNNDSPPIKSTSQRPVSECAAELAAEAFADTSFVPNVARRIAEWRRGGTTLTVVLAQLDANVDESDCAEQATHAPIRKCMTAARATVREMDLVTRWQSNGIAMLLPSTSAADSKVIVRRLKALMATEPADFQPSISLSIGIAEGIEGNDAKRVLERAWLALETARSSGNGNISVHDGVKCVNLKLAPAVR